MFIYNNPVLSLIIFAPRLWSASFYAIFCTLSFSRLFLVLSPTTFININSNRGLYLTGLFVIASSITTTTINTLTCDHDKNYTYKYYIMWNIAPYEIGLGEGECITNFSNLTDSSVTNSGKLRFCKPFPLETIFMSFTLFLKCSKHYCLFVNISKPTTKI